MTPQRFIILLFLLSFFAASSQPQQTIRGKITEKTSGAPIPYSNILVLDTEPLLAAVADSAGYFMISHVPVGRYNLKVSCVGYDDAVMREIVVISAKQTFLGVQLEENSRTLDELTVKPIAGKEQALNAMSLVSGRILSVEQAQRFAGGFDDPARLASAFAGVASSSGFNGIIVRGNAPRYLQWKMEGVEIPNPNHFGDLKSFGGGILTGMSSHLLASSDFMSGAFPAEYNNAMSGVFDISMRKGNNERKERTFQVGIIGIDYSEEGYFKKGGDASYIFNYRNSTLALLQPLLPENADKIKYQDLAFKLYLPSARAGIFSLWGIGLTDGASAKPKTDSLKWYYKEDKQQNDISMQVGAMGLNHVYFLNSQTYIKNTIAATGSKVNWKASAFDAQLQLQPYSLIANTGWNFVWSSYLNKKFNSRHSNKTGFTATQMNYDILLDKQVNENPDPVELVKSRGNSFLLSGYSSSLFNLAGELKICIGLNAQLFTLNGHYTIEPRLALRKRINSRQSVGLAYGLHSRLENLNFYFNNSLSTGEKAVNKNLDFSKAHHVVLGYDLSVSETFRIKVESYYQKLFSVPVVDQSSLSFINLQSDWFFAEKLQNTGEGLNYGLDFTIEKSLTKGFYYLLTASVFEAKYKGGDGVWRDTRFNKHFVFNFLVGKEWQTGKLKQNTFGLNTRFTYQGGNRYSPVDEAASLLIKDVVYDETRAFSKQSDPILNASFTVSYKVNKKSVSHEFALKVLNATGQPDFYGYHYNLVKHSIDKDLATVVLPNLSYKIQF